MKNAVAYFSAIMFCAFVFSGCGDDSVQYDPQSVAIERAQMVQIAKDAYVYGFPAVLMEITKRHMANPLPGTGNAPVNQIRHFNSFADEKFNSFVRPNSDMFYSFAWLDLSKEPMLLEIPDTGKRYSLFTLKDAWTDIVASVGSRASGTKEQKIAITGFRWNGNIPEGFTEYKSDTDIVWLTGLLQAGGGKQDVEAVKKIQAGIKLYPLSSYGNKYTAPKERADDTLPVNPPLEQVLSMNINEFFNILNQSMLKNPPRNEDAVILDKILDLGVAPGMKFELSSFDFDTQEEIKAITKWMKEYIENMMTEGTDQGWVYNYGLGNYNNDYRMRAKTAYLNPGANTDEDTVYMFSYVDADNEKYDLDKKYVLHFGKDELPPVNAAWSISLYNNDGYFVKNSINRYSVGSKDNLKFNKDGSLDIYIQKENPGKDKQSNWMPVSGETFSVMMRCYWPKESLIDTGWRVPSIKKAR